MASLRRPTLKFWDGVRMRRCCAAADPDSAPRPVTLPAAWDEAAAVGLASLMAGEAAVDLASAAELWLATLAAQNGLVLAAEAQTLLLEQRGAPAPAAWSERERLRGVRLNLAAFAPGDFSRLRDAADTALAVAAALWPGERARIGLTGLAEHIAAHGLGYDSAAARDLAAALVAEIRKRAPRATLAVDAADAVDALLGVETSGIAPPFSLLNEAGALSRTTRTLLAARATSPAAALAAVLAGRSMLPVASATAHAAMHATLSPLLDAVAALPAAAPVLTASLVRRRDLPARRGGIAHKAVIGGQKVFLRTGEYPDGQPGEVAITLPQASPAVRTLADCLSHAIGIGLQHGAPLAEFIEALAGTRFGPAGVVEGDPEVARATSAIDYAMRRLAHSYAPHLALPPIDADPDEPPLLPLDLPLDPAQEPPQRRRGLRVVK